MRDKLFDMTHREYVETFTVEELKKVNILKYINKEV